MADEQKIDHIQKIRWLERDERSILQKTDFQQKHTNTKQLTSGIERIKRRNEKKKKTSEFATRKT